MVKVGNDKYNITSEREGKELAFEKSAQSVGNNIVTFLKLVGHYGDVCSLLT